MTQSGYSRLAVERKRNLATTTQAKVAYADVASVDAEYSRAEARATSSTKENFFLLEEYWIPRALFKLPFSTTTGEVQLGKEASVVRNRAFHRACDGCNTAGDLFELMANWGSLIATEVEIGGALFHSNMQKVTMDFSEEKIKNAWALSIKANKGPVAVAAATKGELSTEQMTQFNEQLKTVVTKPIGGNELYAMNAEFSPWLASLAMPNLWRLVKRSGFLPIYVVLDDYRRTRFTNILLDAGEATWKTNPTLKSLRYINFEWFVGFGQRGTDQRLG